MQNDNNSNELSNTMQSNNLFPVILSPTRVATILKPDGEYETTKKLIYNIFINTNNSSQSGIIEMSITDHYPFFYHFKIEIWHLVIKILQYSKGILMIIQ